jgi:hypothetical protein
LSRFFPEEQIPVLKREDFFERPRESLKRVLGFLNLPDWEPVTLDASGEDKNEGEYKLKMDSTVMRRSKEFCEPHNQRLYDYLGQDLG